MGHPVPPPQEDDDGIFDVIGDVVFGAIGALTELFLGDGDGEQRPDPPADPVTPTVTVRLEKVDDE